MSLNLITNNKFKIFNFFYYFVILVVVNYNARADIIRPTTFDERPSCEKTNGMWRDFGNSCADHCEYKFQKYPYCSNGIFYSCDCGKNRCLNDDKCIAIDDYKKIHEQKFNEEKKLLEDAKNKRQKKSKKFQNDYMNKLAGIYGLDPNYRDPYYDQRKRELPANTFKSTNRMLIYNEIIKKRNDKILAIQKKYQQELDMLEKSGDQDQSKIDELKQKLDEISKIKIIQPISEPDLLNEDYSNQDKKNINSQKSLNKQPIILQPINNPNDNNSENLSKNNLNDALNEKSSIEPNPTKQNSIQELLEKASDGLFKNNANNNPNNSSFDKSVEINANKNDDKKSSNESSVKIPPVYIKQQNGDQDFKNGEVIDNSDSFPQFVN